MDDNGLNVIQPGWEVYSSDGERIGRVDEVGPDHLRLELEVLAGSSVPVPLDSVADAADGRVDLDLPTDAVANVTVEEPTGS
jgi:hypothetical protein